jgi:hypothetical protein
MAIASVVIQQFQTAREIANWLTANRMGVSSWQVVKDDANNSFTLIVAMNWISLDLKEVQTPSDGYNFNSIVGVSIQVDTATAPVDGIDAGKKGNFPLSAADTVTPGEAQDMQRFLGGPVGAETVTPGDPNSLSKQYVAAAYSETVTPSDSQEQHTDGP